MLRVHAFVVEFTVASATTSMKWRLERFVKDLISSVSPVAGFVHLPCSAYNFSPSSETASAVIRIESPTESCVMDTLNVLSRP